MGSVSLDEVCRVAAEYRISEKAEGEQQERTSKHLVSPHGSGKSTQHQSSHWRNREMEQRQEEVRN